MTERYSNKRALYRRGGKFRKAQPSDIGLGGDCPQCGHLLVRVYDGDVEADQRSLAGIDPRKFRNRCFTCEPRTEAEEQKLKEQEAASRERAKRFWSQLDPNKDEQ